MQDLRKGFRRVGDGGSPRKQTRIRITLHRAPFQLIRRDRPKAISKLGRERGLRLFPGGADSLVMWFYLCFEVQAVFRKPGVATFSRESRI